MRVLILLCLLAIGIAPAGAQQRYSQWGSDTQGKADSVQDFVDELNRLVDEAEKARAADPLFLRDLRALAGRFDRPWRVDLLSEAFQDGNYTADPVWSVTSGRFWIESGWGLRSSVLATAQSQTTQDDGKLRGEDVAIAILRGVLNKGNENQQSSTTPQPGTPADIHTGVRITNAFSLDLELASWQADGKLVILVYQGGERTAGYRLVYASGQPIELQRATRWGAAIVDKAKEPLRLEDKQLHRIGWTRGADGTMVVAVDGKEMIRVADRGYRDPFDGLRLVNEAGDFTLRQITVMGTP